MPGVVAHLCSSQCPPPTVILLQTLCPTCHAHPTLLCAPPGALFGRQAGHLCRTCRGGGGGASLHLSSISRGLSWLEAVTIHTQYTLQRRGGGGSAGETLLLNSSSMLCMSGGNVQQRADGGRGGGGAPMDCYRSLSPRPVSSCLRAFTMKQLQEAGAGLCAVRGLAVRRRAWRYIPKGSVGIVDRLLCVPTQLMYLPQAQETPAQTNLPTHGKAHGQSRRLCVSVLLSTLRGVTPQGLRDPPCVQRRDFCRLAPSPHLFGTPWDEIQTPVEGGAEGGWKDFPLVCLQRRRAGTVSMDNGGEVTPPPRSSPEEGGRRKRKVPTPPRTYSPPPHRQPASPPSPRKRKVPRRSPAPAAPGGTDVEHAHVCSPCPSPSGRPSSLVQEASQCESIAVEGQGGDWEGEGEGEDFSSGNGCGYGIGGSVDDMVRAYLSVRRAHPPAVSSSAPVHHQLQGAGEDMGVPSPSSHPDTHTHTVGDAARGVSRPALPRGPLGESSAKHRRVELTGPAAANERNSSSVTEGLRVLVSEEVVVDKPLYVTLLSQKHHIHCQEAPIAAPVAFVLDELTGVCILPEDVLTHRDALRVFLRQLTRNAFRYDTLWLLLTHQSSDSAAPVRSPHGEMTALCQCLTQFPCTVVLRQVPELAVADCLQAICVHAAGQHTRGGMVASWYKDRPMLLRLSSPVFSAHCK